MFIALEGPDCSGKTEQIEWLVNRLRSITGRDVLQLAFPSKSPAGAAVRKLLARLVFPPDDPRLLAMVVQSVFLADRYGFVGQIQDCVRRDGIVVVDRWIASGMIYGAEDGVDSDWIAAAQFALPKADLNILLDVDIEHLLPRLCSRKRSLERYENADFQRGIITRYRNLWKTMNLEDPAYWVSVNAAASPEIVHSEIFRHVQSALKGRSFD